jgi:hypothetical protein
MITPTVERTTEAIVFHAVECEKCLRLAKFAEEHNEAYSAGVPKGLRQLAEMSSAEAFSWARHLRTAGGAA